MKKNLLLIILLAMFCIANVGASGKGNFSDGGGILYTQPVKSVIFRHQHHVDVKKISCEKCHSGLFEMQALLVQEKKDFVMDYTALYARDFSSNFNMSESVEVVLD